MDLVQAATALGKQRRHLFLHNVKSVQLAPPLGLYCSQSPPPFYQLLFSILNGKIKNKSNSSPSSSTTTTTPFPSTEHVRHFAWRTYRHPLAADLLCFSLQTTHVPVRLFSSLHHQFLLEFYFLTFFNVSLFFLPFFFFFFIDNLC